MNPLQPLPAQPGRICQDPRPLHRHRRRLLRAWRHCRNHREEEPTRQRPSFRRLRLGRRCRRCAGIPSGTRAVRPETSRAVCKEQERCCREARGWRGGICSAQGGEISAERYAQDRNADRTDTDTLTERRQALYAEAAAANPTVTKRTADGNTVAERPAKINKAAAAMQDEYLPPNKMLVLRDLPKDFTPAQVSAALSQFAGFVAFRPVPGRPLGFADFDDEHVAAVAREALNGSTLGDSTIKVTFQKA
jgi:hypothetical protein